MALLLLALPAAAGDPALLAALGAFKTADEGYTAALANASGPEKARLLERRLVLADIRRNYGAVREILGQLEKLQPDANIRLSMELARANMAARLSRQTEARQAFAKVEGLARGSSPQQLMAQYACQSFAFWDKVNREGTPAAQAYRAAMEPIFSTTLKLVPWPQDPAAATPLMLDLMRANIWTREWVKRGSYTTFELLGAGQPTESAAWGGAVRDLVVGSRMFGEARIGTLTACNTSMAWRYSYDDTLLDSLDYFYFNTDATTDQMIGAGLQLAHQGAADRKALLDWSTANLLGGQAPSYTEDLRQRAQLARNQGLYDILHGQEAKGLRELDEAAQQFQGLGLLADELDTHLAASMLLAYYKPTLPDLARHVQATKAGAERFQDNARLYFALACEGTMHYSKNEMPAAEKSLRAAVALLGDLLTDSGATQQKKQQWVQQAKPVFDMLVQSLSSQKKDAEAMEVVSMQQSATMLANLDRKTVKPPAKAAATYSKVEQLRGANQEIKNEISAAEAIGDKAGADRARQKLAGSQAEYFRALNQLKQDDPSFAGAVSIQPTNFVKIKDVLPEGVVLVQYGMGEKKLYVFVAKKGGLQLHEVDVPAATLRQDVAAVRRAMLAYTRDPGPLSGEGKAALGRLYGSLIAPLEADLATSRLLVVAPAQELYYLPFAALQKEGGPFLVERMPVAVITGLELMEFMKTTKVQALESLLALGNPDGSLPAAGREVDSVAALFTSKKVFVGPQATRDRLNQLGGASVLHLATHGVLDSKDVNQNYLLLANGHLPTGEIYGLDLGGLGLVTLSACQTGVAKKLGDGAELASLAQAFSVAGGHSMLASLWSVSDEATAQLMVAFYENLLKRKMGRAQALQQAQLTLLRNPKTSHPFLWAAFELIGDWR